MAWGGGLHVAAVPYHVAVGVITDDRVILTAQYRGFEFVGYLKCAHLRFKVVSRDFGAMERECGLRRDKVVSLPPLKK